jgi:predicted GNAT superfamily acetyltransferase
MRSTDDYDACVRLQQETWGTGFTENVPATILMVSQKVGGVTAGAFDKNGSMAGFVFGLTGWKNGRPVHWSDMLAVKYDLRNSGLGRILKLYQRELVLPLGIEEIYWTYDPLVAKNAHLNFNKLGAEISEYVSDMYPENSGSDLHRGIGMDRLVVVWRIASDRVKEILDGKKTVKPNGFDSAPVLNSKNDSKGLFVPVESALPQASPVRVEIPPDIQATRNESVETARLWRSTTRKAFVHYLGHGYTVPAFFRDPQSGRCHYFLVKK